MFFVKDLAGKCKVTTDTVRDPLNRYKKYSYKDLQWLEFIHLMTKFFNYTLNEVKEIFKSSERRESHYPKVRKIIQRRIYDNRKLLDQILSLQHRMECVLQE
jgi:DNA-binding transcriptional MerR regulator